MIFGHVFQQQGLVGLASYHFVSPDNCYISYASAPPNWRLADGSAPPAVKHFSSPSYDAASRTFRGTIDWGETPFAGNAVRWEYDMRFGADLRSIVGGVVRGFDADGTEREPIRFGSDLQYELVTEDLALFPVGALGP